MIDYLLSTIGGLYVLVLMNFVFLFAVRRNKNLLFRLVDRTICTRFFLPIASASLPLFSPSLPLSLSFSPSFSPPPLGSLRTLEPGC